MVVSQSIGIHSIELKKNVHPNRIANQTHWNVRGCKATLKSSESKYIPVNIFLKKNKTYLHNVCESPIHSWIANQSETIVTLNLQEFYCIDYWQIHSCKQRQKL